MNALATALREIVGLFIDDGSLAVGALAVTGAVVLAHIGLNLGPTAIAVLLVGGLIAVLLENVRRTARRSRSG